MAYHISQNFMWSKRHKKQTLENDDLDDTRNLLGINNTKFIFKKVLFVSLYDVKFDLPRILTIPLK